MHVTCADYRIILTRYLHKDIVLYNIYTFPINSLDILGDMKMIKLSATKPVADIGISGLTSPSPHKTEYKIKNNTYNI